MTVTDTESLQTRAGTGRSYLQMCLVASVMTMFALLLGVTVTAAFLIKEIQTELATMKTAGKAEDVSSPAAYTSPKYKMQNLAYLYASSGGLGNVTMEWNSVNSVGSGFAYNSAQQALQPRSEGSFLVYMDLVLHCNGKCAQATVIVRVSSQDSTSLECRVQLLLDAAKVRAEKCWRVVQLSEEHRLVANMEVQGKSEGWELDTTQSGLGMFMVEGSRQ